MGKIEIAVLVISGLLILVGFCKGFMKQIFSTSAWLVAIIGAYLLCAPVYGFAKDTVVNEKVYSTVDGFIVNKLGELGTTELTSENLATQVDEAMKQLGLPDFISEKLAKGIIDANVVNEPGTTLNGLLSPAVTKIIMYVLCFIVLFIVCLIVLKIIGKILINIFDHGILGFANRLLGAAFGLVMALLVVNVLLFILPIVQTYIPQVNDFVQADLAVPGGLGLANYFYNNNWITILVNNNFNFEALINEAKNAIEVLG